MSKDPIQNGRVFSEENTQRLERFGFRFGEKGTHTSRTIMVPELTTLLRRCPVSATRADYTTEVMEHNCLGKQTASTRFLTNQRLGELYGLDPSVPLFRVMRHLWDIDEKGRHLLALLAAICRDPLLRVTGPVIIRMKHGEELARQQITDALRDSVGDRLNDDSLDKVVRNTSASWTQSGHLSGRSRKTRERAITTPAVTTFALLLTYMTGVRGMPAFESFIARLLDASPDELIHFAMDAKRLGLLDIKQSGGIITLSFDLLLTDVERKLLFGTD